LHVDGIVKYCCLEQYVGKQIMFLEVGGTPGHEVEEFLAEHIDVIFRSHFEHFGVELFDQIDVLVIDAGR